MYTYFHLLFFCVFVKQVIARKKNKVELGLTLELVPSEVASSVTSFFGDQGYLISF